MLWCKNKHSGKIHEEWKECTCTGFAKCWYTILNLNKFQCGQLFHTNFICSFLFRVHHVLDIISKRLPPIFWMQKRCSFSCILHYIFQRPEMTENDMAHFWLQQDGAAAHTSRDSMTLLRTMFDQRVISKTAISTDRHAHPMWCRRASFCWGIKKHRKAVKNSSAQNQYRLLSPRRWKMWCKMHEKFIFLHRK